MSDQEPHQATAIDFADTPEDGSTDKVVPENDPTEYLPVMRHHLHETLWGLNVALGHAQALDLAESYRQGLTVPRDSPLARQLGRSHLILSQYLGLLDDGGDENGEPIPEDE